MRDEDAALQQMGTNIPSAIIELQTWMRSSTITNTTRLAIVYSLVIHRSTLGIATSLLMIYIQYNWSTSYVK